MAKQLLGRKKTRRIESIIGRTVNSAYANGGDLPHHVYLAWTDHNTAFLVNIKKSKCFLYINNGKFFARRLLKPLRIFVGENCCNGIINNDGHHSLYCKNYDSKEFKGDLILRPCNICNLEVRVLDYETICPKCGQRFFKEDLKTSSDIDVEFIPENEVDNYI